jgi:hypothetical protein
VYVFFNDDGPDAGPAPRQEALEAAFNPSNGWNIVAIETVPNSDEMLRRRSARFATMDLARDV